MIPAAAPWYNDGMNEIPGEAPRFYPSSPRVGVSTAILENGRILLVRRGKEPNKGKWSLPGGLVELGETMAEAAAREVREECSIDVKVVRVLDAVDGIRRDGDGRVEYHFAVVNFLARYTGGEPRADSDAADCRWVPLEEVRDYDTVPSLPLILERNGLLPGNA